MASCGLWCGVLAAWAHGGAAACAGERMCKGPRAYRLCMHAALLCGSAALLQQPSPLYPDPLQSRHPSIGEGRAVWIGRVLLQRRGFAACASEERAWEGAVGAAPGLSAAPGSTRRCTSSASTRSIKNWLTDPDCSFWWVDDGWLCAALGGCGAALLSGWAACCMRVGCALVTAQHAFDSLALPLSFSA